jgi:isopentenyl phosphate kinase
LPVLHGDVILNTVSGEFEVLSGDEVVTFLCEKLPVSRVGFATDVEGIFVEGKIVRKFDRSLLEKIERNGGENLKSDVTGEMTGKLSKIFKMKASCRVYIFKGDYENVAKFLRGEGVGTEIIR